ncbi:hypothetical protein HanPSC8_Chr17g0771981 [Helianthus annuus]|nr:hypothetical protein HanPSC8_Chr17g0771981 [Helianthus annuus]
MFGKSSWWLVAESWKLVAGSWKLYASLTSPCYFTIRHQNNKMTKG